MISEKIFLNFFPIISLGAIDPQGVASLEPRDLICNIYVEDHQTLLHAKYITCGPFEFRRFKIKKVFPALCCHGNQSSNPINPKTLCSLSYYMMMLFRKFDHNWTTYFRDLFENVNS